MCFHEFFHKRNSQNFRFQSQHALHIKICQIVAGSQYHEIFQSNIWRVFAKTSHKNVHLMCFHEFFHQKFHLIHITSVSSHNMHFTLKFVKSLQVSQFHEIFHTNFWRVFDVWPNLVSEAVFLASIKVSSNSHNFRFRSQHGLHIKICQIVAGQSISRNFPI